ncbi:MAG: 3-deoxy-7-phosphoheptulonate synthase [Gammaproteobacteria bacterium]|nr:3-deoxy-7-phosphoheptulonate synthase [Gammaproteobacteria bacterium]
MNITQIWKFLSTWGIPALFTPEELQLQLPIPQKTTTMIAHKRQQLFDIMTGKDDRLVVIIGPCSIHNSESALIYAKKLQTQIKKHEKTLCIIMRTYLEKSRTSVGWKGLINDPDLNLTFDITKGLHLARSLLLEINALGVPTATEIVNPFTVGYFSDLNSWSAIGARTTESQIHRELASNLSMPIGFKNNTNGDIQVAIDAVQSALQPQHFLGLDLSGKNVILKSQGNPHCHVVLRGSKYQCNYDEETINLTVAKLNKLNLINRVMVDCSHGNSQKNHRQQMSVIESIAKSRKNGDKNCFGVMIESHLTAGKQNWIPDSPVSADQSITDACIGWAETEMALEILSDAVIL